MAVRFQGSLFAEADGIGLGPLEPVSRTLLRHGAWTDFRLGWVTGADALFDVLAETVPWQAERRRMYDNVVKVPRLLAFYEADDPLPHPVLTEARRTLACGTDVPHGGTGGRNRPVAHPATKRQGLGPTLTRAPPPALRR